MSDITRYDEARDAALRHIRAVEQRRPTDLQAVHVAAVHAQLATAAAINRLATLAGQLADDLAAILDELTDGIGSTDGDSDAGDRAHDRRVDEANGVIP